MRPLSCVILLAGCTALEPPAAPVQAPAPPAHFQDHWSPAEQANERQAWAHPDQVPMGQMPRRLEVEHLRQSIPRLFGGIQWQDRNENSMWDVLSRTLGEADYVEVTENNVEATPLFAKFMDDMAAQVCSKALDRDAQTAEAEQRLVLRHADVKANLRFLRLKLHGVMVDADNDAAIQDYHQLHQEISAQATMGQAWLGVCMAMLTAPEFLTY
ncbi:MAG: hypothetical protein VYB65_11210 [Myxococcota bacterium]|nr:hypothetical protein [Myxococcota bacterium]